MQPTNSQQVGYNPELGPDQRAETGAEKGLYADVWDAADMDKMPEIDYNGNQVVANNEARAAAASDPNAELPPAEYDFTAMQDAAFNQMGGEAAPAPQDLSELPTAPGEPFTETPDRASVVNQAIAEQVQTGGTAVDIDNVRDKVIGDVGTEGLKADNFADRQEIANQADMTAEDRKSREQEALQAAQNATSEVLAAEQMAVEAINQKATGDLGVSTSEITEKAARAESLADQASSMLSDSQAGSAEALVVNSISSQVKDKVEEIHTSLGEADALAEQVADDKVDTATTGEAPAAAPEAIDFADYQAATTPDAAPAQNVGDAISAAKEQVRKNQERHEREKASAETAKADGIGRFGSGPAVDPNSPFLQH